MFDNSFINRVLHKSLWLLLLPACVLWAAFAALSRPVLVPDTRAGNSEFTTEWQGQPLRPLALSEVEERFARRFPGTLSRLTNGTQVLVLRSVDRPTRMLHPATDCYQGLGYRIAAQQLERDADQRLWRCFEATRGGQRLRVCERIADAGGQGFTDTSAWYWAAVLGQSRGPWQALTVASPL
ncbi:MAG: hypothetical protein Q8K29_09560 [Polaromonas sp.]|nr:hypothetical protein [Polaromonas sp.]